MRKLLLSIALVVCSVVLLAQGVTTASLNGRITDTNGGPLIGATVVALHVPSGTQFGNITDADGYYRLSNMRVGGPYRITISYVGFEDYVENGVSLTLGQTLRKSISLSETAQTLDEVVVTAGGEIFDGNRTGAQTLINRDMIQKLPAASRSIADFVRTTPQAQLREGNDGFSISIAGQNNRYNAIYIDGAVSNDVFGLAGSGTNGGQTGVNPFSVDAIEEFQVSVAPFDVRVSGFSGGAINAITRSGTNDFEGSAYYFVRNQSLAGKTPEDLRVDGEKERLDDFSAKTIGFRVGGPVIKDKLFYFVNYENQNDETPQPFNIANYNGNSSAADLTGLANYVNNTYGYNIGGYDANTRTLKSDKLTAKLDWNVNENHKVSFKHSYVDGENLEARSSNNDAIGFINGSEFFNTTTNSSSLELKSIFGSKFSNNLILSLTTVRDDRDPQGDPFPTVFIADGLSNNAGDGEGISFGAEPFSTANLLDQDVFTITNNFEIYKGNHTITAGIHYEYSKAKNIFFAFNYGEYEYLTVADFMADAAPRIYQRGYSLVSPGAGDETSGAAIFDLAQFGFYVQDEFYASDNLKLTAGLRFDLPAWSSGPVNSSFNTTTISAMEAAGKDLQGASIGAPIETSVNVSPRFGFNWNVNGKNETQVRGGVGVFVSRVPLVWPGGAYNNNGITGGFLFAFGGPGDFNGFRSDINNQYVGAVPGTGQLGGNVDLFAKDFKLPKVLKFNLAVDQKLPWWGLVGSIDFLYNKNLQAIYYENLNVGNAVGTLTGSDNRPVFSRNAIDGDYGRVILGSNTDEGYSWNLTTSLSKPFANGFQGNVSYTYGDSKTIFEGTSSQNSSQWRNIQTVNGKNGRLPTTRSDFALGSRVVIGGSYTKDWNDNAKTTIGVFYDGVSGEPYSYIYNEGRDLIGDDSRDNALIYVPATSGDINLVDFVDGGGNTVTAAQQWTALDAYISADDYLSERRGEYAERNGDRAPWVSQMDLKLIQEFKLSKNSLQLSLDIFNFANFINPDWGQREFINNDEIALITVDGVTDNGNGTFTPAFTYDSSREDGFIRVDDGGIQSSRWQMQFGVRYTFGN
ncbi:MAG: carboxypeptidase regulatory-like domain-containing protein [Cyclobacteriaceae bacterium]